VIGERRRDYDEIYDKLGTKEGDNPSPHDTAAMTSIPTFRSVKPTQAREAWERKVGPVATAHGASNIGESNIQHEVRVVPFHEIKWWLSIEIGGDGCTRTAHEHECAEERLHHLHVQAGVC
jgi:hypothetical protein